VIATNYVDVALAVLLMFAFLRGFSAGLWRSLFNLAGTALAVFVSYLLAGPAVDLIERSYGVLGKMATWWNAVFGSVPGLSLPYDQSSFDQAFNAAGGSGWATALKGALRQNAVAVQALAGPNPTWAAVMGLALARLVLSGVVFLVLLAIVRLVMNLVIGGIAVSRPSSLGVRLLGGILETILAAVWLSVLSGILTPVFNAGLLGGIGEAARSSVVMSTLLEVYRVIWPALVARIG